MLLFTIKYSLVKSNFVLILIKKLILDQFRAQLKLRNIREPSLPFLILSINFVFSIIRTF